MFHLARRFAAESRAVWTDFALTRLHIRHFVDRNVQTQFRSISFLSTGKRNKGNGVIVCNSRKRILS